jgi:hypothetical protein
MTNIRVLLLLAIVAGIAAPEALTAESKRQRIDSGWRDGPVVVDGDYGEWKGPLTPLEDHGSITAAALNDGDSLYIVLSTSDPVMRMQILRQGLIVWFDPGGGTKKRFGVKFPVGAGLDADAARGWGTRRGRDGAAQGSGAPDRDRETNRLEPANRLEVFGPEKDDARSFVADKVPGIAVKVGTVERALVYELKVPLEKTGDFPYAIGAKRGALIGLGLETLKMERPESSERRSGMGGMGGMGGGARGRGGMGGGGMGRGGRGDGNRSDPGKPMKSWATIQLAAH